MRGYLFIQVPLFRTYLKHTVAGLLGQIFQEGVAVVKTMVLQVRVLLWAHFMNAVDKMSTNQGEGNGVAKHGWFLQGRSKHLLKGTEMKAESRKVRGFHQHFLY